MSGLELSLIGLPPAVVTDATSPTVTIPGERYTRIGSLLALFTRTSRHGLDQSHRIDRSRHLTRSSFPGTRPALRRRGAKDCGWPTVPPRPARDPGALATLRSAVRLISLKGSA